MCCDSHSFDCAISHGAKTCPQYEHLKYPTEWLLKHKEGESCPSCATSNGILAIFSVDEAQIGQVSRQFVENRRDLRQMAEAVRGDVDEEV